MAAFGVAGFGPVSGSVFSRAVCVMGGLRNTATAPFTLTGRVDDDDEWRSAAEASLVDEAQPVKTLPVPEPTRLW